MDGMIGGTVDWVKDHLPGHAAQMPAAYAKPVSTATYQTSGATYSSASGRPSAATVMPAMPATTVGVTTGTTPIYAGGKSNLLAGGTVISTRTVPREELLAEGRLFEEAAIQAPVYIEQAPAATVVEYVQPAQVVETVMPGIAQPSVVETVMPGYAQPTVVETVVPGAATYATPTVVETVQQPMTYATAAPTIVETVQQPMAYGAAAGTVIETVRPPVSYVTETMAPMAPVYSAPTVVETVQPGFAAAPTVVETVGAPTTYVQGAGMVGYAQPAATVIEQVVPGAAYPTMVTGGSIV